MSGIQFKSIMDLTPFERLTMHYHTPLAASRYIRKRCHTMVEPVQDHWAAALANGMAAEAGPHITAACDHAEAAIKMAAMIASRKMRPDNDADCWAIVGESYESCLAAADELRIVREMLPTAAQAS